MKKKQTEGEPLAVLSARERDVTELILRGCTETQIAERLGLKLNTVKSYRKSIYAKLDIHLKSELFALAPDDAWRR